MTAQAGTLSRSTKGKGAVVESNNLNPQGNEIVKTDEIKDVEPITTPPDEEAINKAKALVEKTKASYLHAKQALELLTGKAEKTDKTPGVIVTIFTLVKDSGKTGISKSEILDELVKLFPDRTSDQMSKTVSVQLPKRMSSERNVKIEKTTDGKYFMK
jgi:hypothetical protein